MAIRISTAPCCWGVDDPRNPHLPPWEKVLDEAAQAGYRALELGPLGYLPRDAAVLGPALRQRGLSIIAGTIFDDLVTADHLPALLRQAEEICALLTALPRIPAQDGQGFPTPYLVVIDWGHDERDAAAGRSESAPRLGRAGWDRMIAHVAAIAAVAARHGIRTVIHPHAGGYIEFEDEIRRLVDDVPARVAGLCLDTGHLRFSGMDPVEWLRALAPRLDYVHFKDLDASVHREVLRERVRFFAACARGVMCPIGRGAIDYAAVRRTLTEIGYRGFATVEQERDPRDAAMSLRDVTASLEFLKSAGFEA
ncbi:MAG TPA: TIM barrel protein [Anaeromyxobacteraceae bacterium]|nr:TIM barrel protein [Anaeromyxobacteraceae bacterium]